MKDALLKVKLGKAHDIGNKMRIEEIIQEVEEETKAYIAKIQALQDKMPPGFYFQAPEIETRYPWGLKPVFVLLGISIERK